MENFPASDFMSDFEIIEIDNEIYENNRRRLVIEAEEQRLAREAELLELQRQEGERFLIQAAREAEDERNEIEAIITDIHNIIFAQNLFANNLSYRYTGVLPLTTNSSSSQSSSTESNDSNYNDDEEGSGFLRNEEESNNQDE